MKRQPYQGYPHEGLPTLFIWVVFFVVAIIFEDEVRRLLAWAFLLLMAVVTGVSIACEYAIYRRQHR